MKLILLVLAVLLGVSGCTVTPEEFEEAQRACKDHDGLKLYHNPTDSAFIGDSDCNNELTIKSRYFNSVVKGE